MIPMSDDEEMIRVLGDSSSDWARGHPGYFFNEAQPDFQELRDQLILGAKTLSDGTVSEFSFEGWCIVASTDDWFLRGSAREAGRSLFHDLHAFPELGQNCSRPEFVIYTFARDVITRGPDGTSTVKGSLLPTESTALWTVIPPGDWQRVVAFRGLEATENPAAGS
jgi:hypothetical protein